MRRVALAFLLIASLAFADNCPRCRRDVDKSWRYCPACGEAQPDRLKAVDDAAKQAAARKAELLESLRKLLEACREAGDTERAKKVEEELERLGAGESQLGGMDGPAVAAYAVRIEKRGELSKRAGMSEESEKAVDAGLMWLARHQKGSGAWSSSAFDACCAAGTCGGPGESGNDAGVTGLAVLAFLGAGITPKSELSWKDAVTGRAVAAGDVVRRGIAALVAMQDEEGCVGGRRTAKYMYSHAIGALALAEAYGMTGAEGLRGPAQRAVDFLLMAQNPGRGWRYAKQCGDSDTSVTSWAVAALDAANVAGLKNAKNGFAGAKAWIDEVTDPTYFRVGYTARGTGKVLVQGRNEEWDGHEALTAAAMTARMRMEAKAAPEILDAQAKLLVSDLPVWMEHKVDMYYWYHGSEALFTFDGAAGKYWKAWAKTAQDALVKHQEGEGCAAGSWDPAADRWGFEGGRVYTTAIGVLTLETPYRDARTAEAPPRKKEK